MSDLLASARRRRAEKAADASIDAYLDERLSARGTTVDESAKGKLRNLLRRTAQEATPIRSVVKANMKRLGPGRTEAVAATIKGHIKGKKTWVVEGTKLSDDYLVVDGDVLLALDAISENDLSEVFLEARAIDEHQTREAVALLGANGTLELRTWGDGVALKESE